MKMKQITSEYFSICPEEIPLQETAEVLVELAATAGSYGISSIEPIVGKMNNASSRRAVMMAVDSESPDEIRVMAEEMADTRVKALLEHFTVITEGVCMIAEGTTSHEVREKLSSIIEELESGIKVDDTQETYV